MEFFHGMFLQIFLKTFHTGASYIVSLKYTWISVGLWCTKNVGKMKQTNEKISLQLGSSREKEYKIGPGIPGRQFLNYKYDQCSIQTFIGDKYRFLEVKHWIV